MKIIRVINDELIDLREIKKPNLVFNTNEYSDGEDLCIFHEQINPFDLYYENERKGREIDRLKVEYERIYNENCKLREQHNINDISLLDENNRLNNIINELEKWCNECIDNHIIAREHGYTTISDTFFEIFLDKLKELKENKK